MPYTLNNIPVTIKKLSINAKKIWISAFNSEFKRSQNEQKAIQAGWGAVKNAGYKKDNDGVWRRWE